MKILLVEDDRQLAEIVTANLKSQKFTVEWAENGELGLDMVVAAEPDAIIVDYDLPKLNGHDLCKQVRANNHDVPILMLTSRSDVQDKIAGLDAGADDYLTKPFNLKELAARLRALMRRGSREGGTPILEWGPLSLNPATCEVFYGDRLVPLRPKEYALLELFMRNPKQLFSRDVILDRLWTFDDVPNEETIKAHVKGMRKHLKQVGAPGKLIEAVYGMGYRLNSQYENVRVEPTVVSDPNPTGSPKKQASESLPADASDALSIPVVQWQQLKPKMLERVQAIATATEAISSGFIQDPSVQTGIREAHKLAGILGTVGFLQGTALARQIEAQLKSQFPSFVLLQQLLQDLKQELETDPDSATVAELSVLAQTARSQSHREQPLSVLAIATEPDVTSTLMQSGKQHGITCTHVMDVESAKRQVEHSQPDILAIAVGDLPATVRVLGELAEAVTAVPTLALVNRVDLAHRVTLTRLGVKRVLDTSLSKHDRWFETIRSIHQQQRPQSATLLAVDDDPEFLALLSSILEPWGFKVVKVSDAACAWTTMDTLQPDLILLDVDMPGINGVELCQAIRSDERLWETPILILTSLHTTEWIQQVFVAGADGIVKKPLVGSELIVRIFNQLERRGIHLQQRQMASKA